MNLSSIFKAHHFKVGNIYKMSVGKRSHVIKPYYVEVIKVGIDYIITNIPGCHSLKISKENGNWEYQTSRMTFIGEKKECGHLLLNQF